MYKNLSIIILLSGILLLTASASSAQSIAVIKKELAATTNPLGYVKFKLKKQYKIDTVTIASTTAFVNFVDSLAYVGKEGRVYGPFNSKKGKYLYKILAKVPNTFFHVSHILLDTTTFRKKFADSLANKIMQKIKSGEASFESMSATYSSDNRSAVKGGDLGWFSKGVMLPQLEDAVAAHKKGDVFKVWTDSGLHIVTIKDNPKEDAGFVLMLRVML